MPAYKFGFSLVELSIVLVILGLLTGGVLTGQSLIRASELRSVATQYSQFSAANNSFRDKYFAIPGDMLNATSFWGASASCPGTAGTGTQTCNGNGNGTLQEPPAASQYGENFAFWQHLANAGLIEGSYTGRAGAAATTEWVGGTNAPKSKLSNGIWMVSWDSTSGGAMYDVAITRHNFRVGAQVSGAWPSGLLLGTDEAWNIDTKLDDGQPALGIVTGPKNSYGPTPSCTTSAISTAQYNISTSGRQCILFFGL